MILHLPHSRMEAARLHAYTHEMDEALSFDTVDAPAAQPVPPADLLADVEPVCRELGRAPSRADYRELGAHRARNVAQAWGTWSDAKSLAWRRVRFDARDSPVPR
jgi:hypothetical protein